jgi:hypothetical protein
MSELTAHEPVERETVFRKTRRRTRLSAVGIETLALFGVSFAAYAALGYRIVVQQHVVVFDALSRLAHAYFVWHNQPPKLAAVGFVWPPLSTIVFLPFAAIKPVATSLAALPLTSAVFGAALLCVLNRIFQLAEMSRLQRALLLLAFAVNPLILFYATNGMSEIVYLYFLVAGVYFFFKWYLERVPSSLILAAVCFSAGILSRYEVITWALVLTGVVVLALIRQHVSRTELEGTMIAYLAPISYGVSLWLFFNWLILDDPLFFLRNQAPGGTRRPGEVDASLTTGGDPIPAADVAARIVDLNVQLFPLTVVVLVALVGLFLVRRDLMSFTIATLISLNAAFTGILIYVSKAESYIQLRYNMRAMPLALVGVAWLYLLARDRGRRALVVAGAFAVMVSSLPLTWHTMKTFEIQYMEQAFTRALATWDDQEGTGSRGGYGVGIAAQRDAAERIKQLVDGRNSILTDDAQTFSVMLLTGRPGLFFDRIDRGDQEWLEVLGNPWGRVPYVFVSTGGDDFVRLSYPGIVDGTAPGFTTVFKTEGFVLARVASTTPTRR